MNARMELGRIAGIPIYLDMFFVLVVVLFSSQYFTKGDATMMSAGLVIIAGLFLSILLHELGHAFAALMFKTGVSEINLTGLGGVTQFDRSLPKSALARTVIYLAGPAANLGLWLGLTELSQTAAMAAKGPLAFTLATLASYNLILLIFNLLPAYPLDGGHTLDAWIGALAGGIWATRIVGVLGLLVAAYIAYISLPLNLWMLLLAFLIGQTNWEALQSVGGFPGGRRR